MLTVAVLRKRRKAGRKRNGRQIKGNRKNKEKTLY